VATTLKQGIGVEVDSKPQITFKGKAQLDEKDEYIQ
jgi:hypothetical protein